MEEKKNTVYIYVGHERGVATDFAGNKKRNGWIKTDIELGPEEVIEKITYLGEMTGGNNMVARRSDMNDLIREVMTLCDAMIGDKEQRDAWKRMLKKNIYDWHDSKMARYNLFDENDPGQPRKINNKVLIK